MDLTLASKFGIKNIVFEKYKEIVLKDKKVRFIDINSEVPLEKVEELYKAINESLSEFKHIAHAEKRNLAFLVGKIFEIQEDEIISPEKVIIFQIIIAISEKQHKSKGIKSGPRVVDVYNLNGIFEGVGSEFIDKLNAEQNKGRKGYNNIPLKST